MSVTQQSNSTKSPGTETLTGPLLVVLAVVVVAGLLFGYDQGVISGALDGIKRQFSLSAILVEVVTSWVTLGALVGSLGGGWLADHYGRRRAVLIAGALFVVGALLQATAPDVTLLVFGRLVVGFGVGVAAVAAPLYGSELAPAAHRGRFVAAYQLAITIGIFLAYLVNAGLAADGDWRWMLGISLVPGVLLVLVGSLGVESPRWLVKMGRRDEARAVLGKVWPGEDNTARLTAIEHTLDEEAGKASWREVFDPAWRKPLVIALGLAIFQQITGINAIIYYANQIFAAAGFSTAAQQTTATTWAVGGVNVAATFIAIAFIDKLGRRPLLLVGLVGMGLALLVVGLAFLSIDGEPAGQGPTTAGIVTLIALVVFIVSFAFSLGPVVWTVINEIFPGKVRGRAVAVATAVNWGSAFLVSQFFLTLIEAIGKSTTFWLFAFFCAVGWVWVYRTVPETKGRSLEEIERSWTGQAAPAAV
ncbi:MAG: sugar porter family MFS transporter [Mesorhizobium sp.]|nr:sugar porter family MFS transporter [Mesorhizobium sp.]MBL8577575.1 sugar porter family MFS transporter [Mesorhizobium sp.]